MGELCCPLKTDSDGDSNYCLEEACAWWDTDFVHCLLVTISNNLTSIRTNLKTLNNKLKVDRISKDLTCMKT